MTTRRIVCLANSRKPGGTCVAGRELSRASGAWIRPVSARRGQEVSSFERRCEDGSDPGLLDILDVPLLRHQPEGHQSENWLLDPDHRWVKRGRCLWESLSGLGEIGGGLWEDGFHSTDGTNDRIPEMRAVRQSSSLKLIHVDNLQLEVSRPHLKKQVRGHFEFDGSGYGLRVTDPDIERRFTALGVYDLPDCYLTVSLAEPWRQFCYKLVAAVMLRPGGSES